MIPLPEGMEVSVLVYFTSDKEDVDIVVTLSGMKAFPSERLTPDAGLFMKQLPDFTDDWRLMTSQEISEYKAKEND